jgi:hypothetical protein
MFDVIERLKASNDPDADQKDKIDIDTAKAISEAGKIIIDAAKVEVDAMRIVADHIDITKPFKDNDSILSLPENS